MVHFRKVGPGTVVCRPCRVAGYLIEEIPGDRSTCPPGFIHNMLTRAKSWHQRCRRPCSCDHKLPEDICDGALLLPVRSHPRDLHRHQAVH